MVYRRTGRKPAVFYREKTFKMKRISELRLLPRLQEHGSASSTADVEKTPVNAPLSLDLLFSSSIAYRALDFFEPSRMNKQSDGSLRVTLEIHEGERLYSFLMSFGAELTVLEPHMSDMNCSADINRLSNTCKHSILTASSPMNDIMESPRT